MKILKLNISRCVQTCQIVLTLFYFFFFIDIRSATSPTAGKSFLEIQMEQQKIAISNPPPVQKQSGSAWNTPSTNTTASNHLPARHANSSGGAWQTQPAVQQRLPRTSESDDDFWDLCMKDIPAAHRPASLPQSHTGQTKTAAARIKKMDKQEVSCQGCHPVACENLDFSLSRKEFVVSLLHQLLAMIWSIGANRSLLASIPN